MNSLSLAAFLVELLPVLVAVAVYLPAGESLIIDMHLLLLAPA
jgi:hypothetical protein